MFLAPIGRPDLLNGYNTSSTSLQIVWQPVPIRERHGVVIGYDVFWNKSDEASHTFTTNISLDIFLLTPYEFYLVKVAGRTSVGPGPNATIVVQTDEDSKFARKKP